MCCCDDRLDLDRGPVRHLGLRPGGPLLLETRSPLEGSVALSALATAAPDLALADPTPPYKENLTLRGLAALPSGSARRPDQREQRVPRLDPSARERRRYPPNSTCRPAREAALLYRRRPRPAGLTSGRSARAGGSAAHRAQLRQLTSGNGCISVLPVKAITRRSTPRPTP